MKNLAIPYLEPKDVTDTYIQLTTLLGRVGVDVYQNNKTSPRGPLIEHLKDLQSILNLFIKQLEQYELTK